MSHSRHKEKRAKRSTLLSSGFYYRLSESLLLLSFAVSAFLLLALLTYHRSDPSWSYFVVTDKVLNATGRMGAWVSDFLLYLLGYIAYLLPIAIVYATCLAYRRYCIHHQKTLSIDLLFLRIVGFFLVLMTSAGLINAHLYATHRFLPFSAGGILGTVISTVALRAFNPVGSDLILSVFLLIGITLLLGVSWLSVAESIGEAVMLVWQLLRCNRYFQRFSSIFVRNHAPQTCSAGKVKKEERDLFLSKVSELPVLEKEKKTVARSAEGVTKKQKSQRSRSCLPSLELLSAYESSKLPKLSREMLEKRSFEVEARFADFNVVVKVTAVHPGPVVTRFELALAAGTKVGKITALVKDLARSLSVISVRVVEVIPGKSVIGLELPNQNRATVTLQEVLATTQYANARSPLTLALGKDIAGHPVIVDLAKMPHLLVAGTTGSGKSVGLNAMLMSLLYKSTPEQLRFILIDPKMLELSVYDGIPHLLTPVVTDMKDAAKALRWCVAEMERRYRLMASLGVRNIGGYNEKISHAKAKGKPLLDLAGLNVESQTSNERQELPYIVVLADEFADMMVLVGKKVETLIARLAQKARAAGIHLIFATQRPSVDVITGLIKANIPTRIGFQVSSKVDSRTILDQQGAEQLLGHGDMLYLPPGSGLPIRVHGAFVNDDEVHRVVGYLKERGSPNYYDGVLSDELDTAEDSAVQGMANNQDSKETDPLYDKVVSAVLRSRRASVSSVQRQFKIGYNRAARIVEAMEEAKIVSPMENNGQREVLVPVRED